MPFLTFEEREFLKAVSRLAYVNPFLPERIDVEREVLGDDFREGDAVWRPHPEVPDTPAPNPEEITRRVEECVAGLRERLSGDASVTQAELALIEDAVFYALFYRYYHRFILVITETSEKTKSQTFDFFSEFERDWKHFLEVPGVQFPRRDKVDHFFALFFQVSRAFHNIFRYVVGGGPTAAQLRASIWQSIFTHDMRRYTDALYNQLDDVTTLIIGPTGTGKELAARAIGLSRFIEFDPETKKFASGLSGLFYPVNLSALSPSLIESELFGHVKGAFTDAVSDRMGRLQFCGKWGAVFLDEIGEVDPAIQVKLLRVLQTREFQRVGDHIDLRFGGKAIAATNRDLAEAMRTGQFREDLYYRLCSDVVVTPCLHEQLQESPEVLQEFLRFIARKVAEPIAHALAEESEAWILENLGRDYQWPGNFREMEQCVRGILVRKQYHPTQPRRLPAHDEFVNGVSDGSLTADELLSRYCTLVYSQTGSYQETARRLRLDRRTVKAKVNPEMLLELRT